MTRLPLGPLTARLGDPSVADLAAMAGVSARTVARWVRDGLSADQADVLAIDLLALHPGVVWPDWWDSPLVQKSCRPRLTGIVG